MKIAYVVSRFPAVTETFIVRELDGVSAAPQMEVSLLSLFPARSETVHPRAAAWVDALQRPSAGRGLRDLVWWLCRRPGALLLALGATIAGCLRKPDILARSLATLPLAASHARLAREQGIQYLHAASATYPALTAWLCGRLAGIPYSFTAHAQDIYTDQSLLARKVAEARFVVAVSDFNRRFLEQYGGGDVTPVHVVHPGIEPELFAFAPDRIPDRGPIAALCVASLQEYKGHAVLLEAIAEPGLERIVLSLVGDGPLRKSLERRCASLGIADRVRFLGSRTEPEVRELLAEAQLFVLPSVVAADGQMEGLPSVLMEALACGLPTVTTRLSGIPEIIRDGETGLLVEPGDPVELGAALRAVSRGEAPAPETGRRLVEREFDIRHSARRLVELFEAEVSPDRSSTN